jgi:hypothetical protein
MKRVVLLILLVVSATPAARQRIAKPAVSNQLPPLSYVCPMAGDEEVIEDKAGRCRKCGMELKPIRLDSIWTCPVHSVIAESKPGKCPIDSRELVQVTVAVSWTCPTTNVESMSPGKCADGSPMVKKFMPRPHGNHNPQHGGLFFMAPDNWHHLEGTYRNGGVFRMYLYDDFTRPLANDQVRQMTGRVITKGGASFPLVPVQNGRYLEAKVGTIVFPAEMAAKLKFKTGAPEHHFDFAFPEYSKEPAAPRLTDNAAASQTKQPPSTQSKPSSAASPTSAVSTPSVGSLAETVASGGVDPGLIPLPIPDSVPEMLAQLSQRTEQIRRFIDQGQFASVYVPAFQAKDLALALDERKQDLIPEHRRIAEPAIKRLVRSAWLLDAFGDIGNKQQISEAYTQFAAAVKDVESVFPQR